MVDQSKLAAQTLIKRSLIRFFEKSEEQQRVVVPSPLSPSRVNEHSSSGETNRIGFHDHGETSGHRDAERQPRDRGYVFFALAYLRSSASRGREKKKEKKNLALTALRR